MTVQLRSIAIYSHHSKCRKVDFNLNSLNILTGVAKRGKSALLEIVDFCWGRDKCYIPHGEISSKVSWFAIHLDYDKEGILVARKNPIQNKKFRDEIYFKRSVDELPENSEKFHNSISLDKLRENLIQLLGFPENFNLPELKDARKRTITSAESVILFCLQKQSEIASNQTLFHRQSEPNISKKIKEFLPYFLGALSSQDYLNFKKLQKVENELDTLLLEKNKNKPLITDGVEVSDSLVEEAIKAGLIQGNINILNDKDAHGMLENVTLPTTTESAVIIDPNEGIQELKSQHAELEDEYLQIGKQIDTVRGRIKEFDDFEFESKEQISRLDSINLVDKTDESQIQYCPLCEQELKRAIPTIIEINETLNETKQQFISVEKDKIRFIELLKKLESDQSKITKKIQQIQKNISNRIAKNEELKRENSFLTEQAIVAGKISFYLRYVKKNSNFDSDEQIADLYSEKEELENLSLSQESIEEMLDSNLESINKNISDYAKLLNLEYSEGELKFDSEQLTVIADRINEVTKLNEMGGAANFVGYHISVCLALHKHFVELNSPIPRFLILDQPSQVHYPPEQISLERSQERIDEDQVAVKNLFKFIYQYCVNHNPNMQVIVIDHVHLQDDWFVKSISEVWRDEGCALVPEDWPSLSKLASDNQPNLFD